MVEKPSNSRSLFFDHQLFLRKIWICFLLFWASIHLLPAQDYRFNVVYLKAELTANADSTIDLFYTITLAAEPDSHAIDIVDIGMPNPFYDKASADASIDGKSIALIRDSEYVRPGVEVHLGANQIPPGETGTLEFHIRVSNLIFQDSQDEALASLEFQTTWFGKEYVSGQADAIEIQFNLPEGTTNQNVRYHDFGQSGYTPTDSSYQNNRVSYLWRWVKVPANQAYSSGASFPKNLVSAVYTPPRTSLKDSFSRLLSSLLAFFFGLMPLWIPVTVIVIAIISNRRRMKRYLPPKIGIESGGIKRGLTPPEAALLQELPLGKVLLLITFGLLKKGAVEIKEEKEKKYCFADLKKEGLELRDYEQQFLAAIGDDGRLREPALKTMFTDMIRALAKKMEGFSRRETNHYYQAIMNKAWHQVRNCPKDKLPAQLAVDLEWMALDERFDERFNQFPTADDDFKTAGGYWYTRLPGRGPYPTSQSPTGGRSLSQLATQFVDSFQTFSTVLVGGSFTQAVTRITNPPPAHSSTGSGGHSGGSCACACACAGCACACAGGGR